MKPNASCGHMAAFVTILIWGTTFISTKVLLRTFTPIEILLIRFLIGYVALLCIRPHRLKMEGQKQEWYFAAAGLCGFGHDTIPATRRIFFYGLVFMIPISWAMGVHVEIQDLSAGGVLPNLLFLGLGASALCFVTWNTAVKHLGSVKTSVYIYMVPVITAVTSALVLRERITATAVCGMILALAGLFLSEKRSQKKEAVIYGTACE